MMKDYYKILGVKEDASEEEIRARWIELTKHYHPDRGEGKVSNERIKDINEAYQVLKHSSTRVEYDLRRTYGPQKRERGRGFFYKRYGILISIPILFIILSIIYFHPPQIPLHSKLISLNDIKQINRSNPINPMTQKLSDKPNSTKPTNPRDPSDLTPPVTQFKPSSLLAREEEVRSFFERYIESYHRMDLEGLLSLFSLKAIQNQKEGYEEIKNAYSHFFNEGKEIRYRIQDMKIGIYQNAAEVMAYYELEQLLKTGGEKRVWRGQVRWVLNKENEVLKIVSLDDQP